ncbi:hypothetical protein PSACC_02671 [Paramicrosporidium saccamoebae]|uniref:THIF-type NAD/FAD binding fold domain-containing protein n=1 Tax=Paramicrosporidium saccamoebae TaxID=1246581 RepID=A0A2H9TIG3_9FUNG|nr:hypothetical protein PSACC_02671 [Paramicrosporidium saccamoebae]
MSVLSKEDEALYDRQIRLWGRDAQQKIRNGQVVIGGQFTGVAHEIVKNLVLKGIGKIMLLTWGNDSEAQSQTLDTSSFLFRPEGSTNLDIARGIVSQAALMNPTVELVHRHLDSFDEEAISGHSMFILVNEKVPSNIFQLDDVCKKMSVPFQYILTQKIEALVINSFQDYKYTTEITTVVDGEQVKKMTESSMEFASVSELWRVHENTPPPSGRVRRATPGIYSQKFQNLQRAMISSEGINVGDHAAVNSVMGAISAQEAIKVVTRKDMPLHNVLLFDGSTLESTVLSIK